MSLSRLYRPTGNVFQLPLPRLGAIGLASSGLQCLEGRDARDQAVANGQRGRSSTLGGEQSRADAVPGALRSARCRPSSVLPLIGSYVYTIGKRAVLPARWTAALQKIAIRKLAAKTYLASAFPS